MTETYISTILLVVTVTALLSLLYSDLYISVILLSIFSFLSALLLYVAHAPDVAITEAAVGAGMTTFIFVWAVRTTAGSSHHVEGRESLHSPKPESKTKRSIPVRFFDIILVVAVAVVLLVLLPPIEGGPELLRDYIARNGYKDTGALNLVSAVYLGYRAFDTFGETIVLLCAVSGSVFLLSEKR